MHGKLLELEVAKANRDLFDLERRIAQHRSNPSENGSIFQMEEIAARDKIRAFKVDLMEEIKARTTAGTFQAEPIEREVAAKDHATIPPVLRPVHKPSVAAEDQMEGEELPIKVIDKGLPRAWRPSDGPIYGNTPADTITDLSKTTAPLSKK